MLHVEVMGDSASDVLTGEKGHFSENSTPVVKPNSLPLSEINLPSFRDKSRLSSPKVTAVNNSCTAVDSATSSTLYSDLSEKFGVLNLNDYSPEIQLQRLHQQQKLRQTDSTDFSSSHKNKLSGSGDVRDIVDQLHQRHSPYKTTPATTPILLEHQLQHQFHTPSYDQRQILKSLLGDQLSPGGDCLPYPISLPSYHPLDSLSHELNSLSQYLGTKAREESLLSHLSPSSEEFKSFAKQMDPNLMDINHNAAYGSPYYGSSSSENESLKDLKMSEYSDLTMGSNAQLSEALLQKLRQQNSLAKQHLPAVNVMDFSHYGMPKKDVLARQMALSNFASSLEQEHIAKLYLNELVKENPNFLASQLFANLPATNLPFNLGSFTNSHMESYSRKVFVGGLPPDSDEDEITASFRQFGPLIVDWPHKAETKTNFPPKGYCFLLFQDEMSVQNLMESCYQEDGKSYWCIAGASQKEKPARRVQIRPWCLVDSDFVMDGSQPLDLRKTIFVGGVPRPLKAVELAMAMNQLYGGVCYAGIDTDPELKYPKGAGRVSFSNQQSYIAAISARFVQLQFGDIDKRVEVKPYVLDDQLCDECQGQKCAGKSAPYFCANVACLQYYCEICWVQIHSRPGREFHKPLVKEGADRPKSIPPFKW